MGRTIRAITSTKCGERLFIDVTSPLLTIRFRTTPRRGLRLKVSLRDRVECRGVGGYRSAILLSKQTPSCITPPCCSYPRPIICRSKGKVQFALTMGTITPKKDVGYYSNGLLVRKRRSVFICFAKGASFKQGTSTPRLRGRYVRMLRSPSCRRLGGERLKRCRGCFGHVRLSLGSAERGHLTRVVFRCTECLVVYSSEPKDRYTGLRKV